MFWTILGVLFVLWLLGFMFKIAGGLIHLLLLLVVIILVIRLVMYLVDA